jgi:EamA domain-containing membrane protein RarD
LYYLLAFTSKWEIFLKECKNIFSHRKYILSLLASALLISTNWFFYIWSVNKGQVVEASLGYYINPLINVLLGMLILKEKLSFWQVISFLLALIGAGAITAVPLLFFAQGARRIAMSMIGFLQYIAPTISLGLGIFLFHEPFTKVHLISFLFIWCALLIYSCSRSKWMIGLETRVLGRKTTSMSQVDR